MMKNAKEVANKASKPVYIFQCIVCRKKFKTSSTTYRHCDELTQWVSGIEGIGINGETTMQELDRPTRLRIEEQERRIDEEKTVTVSVTGYIVLSKRNLDNIMAYDEPKRGLLYGLSMAYINTEALEFSYEEQRGGKLLTRR
jgi:hypothetical protein